MAEMRGFDIIYVWDTDDKEQVENELLLHILTKEST